MSEKPQPTTAALVAQADEALDDCVQAFDTWTSYLKAKAQPSRKPAQKPDDGVVWPR